MALKRLIAASLLGAFAIGGIAAMGASAEPMEGKNNPTTFDGVLWATYRYMLDDIDPGDGAKDFNAFAIDRVYLTMTSKLGDRYTGRGRVEMTNFNGGVIETFLKTADIVVAEPFGLKNRMLRFGQTEGAISPFLEKPWGYRVISKSTTDRYLGVSTVYLGAGLSGTCLDGMVESDILVANRAAFSKNIAADGDPKYKTFAGRVYLKPIKEGTAKGLGFGGYAQYAARGVGNASDNNDLWYGGHAFFEGSKLVAGGQYDAHVVKIGGKDVTAAVISGLARYAVAANMEIFGRVDIVDFNTDTDDVHIDGPEFGGTVNGLAQTVLIGGISRAYSKTLRAILDVQVRSITDKLYVMDKEIDLDNEIIATARLDAKL